MAESARAISYWMRRNLRLIGTSPSVSDIRAMSNERLDGWRQCGKARRALVAEMRDHWTDEQIIHFFDGHIFIPDQATDDPWRDHAEMVAGAR
jgi:hypothetical protein